MLGMGCKVLACELLLKIEALKKSGVTYLPKEKTF